MLFIKHYVKNFTKGENGGCHVKSRGIRPKNHRIDWKSSTNTSIGVLDK